MLGGESASLSLANSKSLPSRREQRGSRPWGLMCFVDRFLNWSLYLKLALE
jgi:hypothetical protein